MVLLGAAVVAVGAFHDSLLRLAGWALVSDEVARQPADAIVIAIDVDGAGVLEAADLVHGGIARRVAVFADPPDAVDRQFLDRGVADQDRAAIELRQLRALGVTDVEQIPRQVAGTEDEGSVLPAWCDRNGLRSIVVVTSPDHSRRLRRVLNRAMIGHRTTVVVRRSRYADFDPDRWWRSRAGARTEIVELQKLVLDFVRHPLS